MEKFFWVLIVMLGLGLIPFFILWLPTAIINALPDFISRRRQAAGAEAEGMARTYARWWGGAAMIGGVLLLPLWVATEGAFVSIIAPAIIFSIGGSAVLWGADETEWLERFNKSRGLAGAFLGSILVVLLIVVVVVKYISNPNAGWYPVQVRMLSVPIVGGKTEKVCVVPTPSGGFFKADDVFGVVNVQKLQFVNGVADTVEGIVKLPAGVEPNLPGYILKYSAIDSTSFVLVSMKESWKPRWWTANLSADFVREHRSLDKMFESDEKPLMPLNPDMSNPATVSAMAHRSSSAPINWWYVGAFVMFAIAVLGLGCLAFRWPAHVNEPAWVAMLITFGVIAVTLGIIGVFNKSESPAVQQVVVPINPPIPPDVNVPTQPADPPIPPVVPTASGNNIVATNTPSQFKSRRDSVMDSAPLFDPETSAEHLRRVCSNSRITTPRLRQAAGCDN